MLSGASVPIKGTTSSATVLSSAAAADEENKDTNERTIEEAIFSRTKAKLKKGCIDGGQTREVIDFQCSTCNRGRGLE